MQLLDPPACSSRTCSLDSEPVLACAEPVYIHVDYKMAQPFADSDYTPAGRSLDSVRSAY